MPKGSGAVTDLRKQLGQTDATPLGRLFGLTLQTFRQRYISPGGLAGTECHNKKLPGHSVALVHMASVFLDENGQKFWPDDPNADGYSEKQQYSKHREQIQHMLVQLISYQNKQRLRNGKYKEKDPQTGLPLSTRGRSTTEPIEVLDDTSREPTAGPANGLQSPEPPCNTTPKFTHWLGLADQRVDMVALHDFIDQMERGDAARQARPAHGETAEEPRPRKKRRMDGGTAVAEDTQQPSTPSSVSKSLQGSESNRTYTSSGRESRKIVQKDFVRTDIWVSPNSPSPPLGAKGGLAARRVLRSPQSNKERADSPDLPIDPAITGGQEARWSNVSEWDLPVSAAAAAPSPPTDPSQQPPANIAKTTTSDPSTSQTNDPEARVAAATRSSPVGPPLPPLGSIAKMAVDGPLLQYTSNPEVREITPTSAKARATTEILATTTSATSVAPITAPPLAAATTAAKIAVEATLHTTNAGATPKPAAPVEFEYIVVKSRKPILQLEEWTPEGNRFMDKTLEQVVRSAFNPQPGAAPIPGLVFTLHLPDNNLKWIVEGLNETLFRAAKTHFNEQVRKALAKTKERPMVVQMWIELLSGVQDEVNDEGEDVDLEW